MKKSIFLLAAAAAAFASCTQSEVMEVAENRAIGFNAFVGKTTKAVTEIDNDNIKAFHVYGKDSDGDIFNGEQVYESGTPNVWIYDNLVGWEASQTYSFAAYSDGGVKDNASTTASVAWNGTNLTITGYDAGQTQKDLLVSIASNADVVASTNAPVAFTFQHALALIKFTINSDLGDGDNAITITGFKVTGIKSKGDLDYTTNNVAWTNWNTPLELNSADFVTESSTPGVSDSFVVIPGESNVSFGVEFTATIGNGTIPAKTLTATISNQNWTAGYRYNYVATITGADMDVITFADPQVTPWEDAAEGNMDFN